MDAEAIAPVAWDSHNYSYTDNYFTKVWWNDAQPDRVVVLQNRRDRLFYVTCDDFTDTPDNDIGPYPTLEEAQIAAIVLTRMGAGPK